MFKGDRLMANNKNPNEKQPGEKPPGERFAPVLPSGAAG
jgi:hypothetical protein